MTHTSSDLAGILRAILEDPSDMVPRLAYADWLEEFGTTEADQIRAEFIRTGRLRDNKPLPEWSRPWYVDTRYKPGYIHTDRTNKAFQCGWHRGFIRKVTCAIHDFARHHKDIFAEHPVTDVRLTYGAGDNLFPMVERVANLAHPNPLWMFNPSEEGFEESMDRLRDDLGRLSSWPVDLTAALIRQMRRELSHDPELIRTNVQFRCVANWARRQQGLPEIPLS